MSFSVFQRYVISLMTNLSLIVIFLMRDSWFISLRHKSKKDPTPATLNFTEHCSSYGKSSKFTPVEKDFFSWSRDDREFISSIYYIGYTLGHFPAGVLADLYGGKHVLGISMVGFSVIVLIVPLVLTVSNGSYALAIILQIIMGFAAGAVYPSIHSVLSHWMPIEERGTLSGISFSGSQFGIGISKALSGLIIEDTRHWFSTFLLYGSLGILWFVVWVCIGYSRYSNSPLLSSKEYEYLKDELGPMHYPPYIPWFSILKSLPLWALIITHLGHVWIWHSLSKYLPKYLKEVLNFDLSKSQIISSLPYIANGISTIAAGILADFIINRKYTSRTTCRKVFTTFGAIGPGVYILAAVYSKCYQNLSLACFTIAMISMGFYYAGSRVNAFDLAPNFSGVIMALMNGLGGITGFVTPYIANEFLNTHMMGWKAIFWFFFAVLTISNIVFVIWGTSHEQPWNQIIERRNTMTWYSEDSVSLQFLFKDKDIFCRIDCHNLTYKPSMCSLSRRYLFVFLINLGIIISFLIRAVFYVTTKRILTPRNVSLPSNSKDYCHYDEDDAAINHYQYKTLFLYDWSLIERDYVRSAYFLGYAISHLPCGILSDLYGGKYLFLFALLLASLLNFCMPVIIQKSDGDPVVVAIWRLLIGVSCGMVYPSVNSLLSKWTPEEEKGRLSSIPFAASQFGIALNNILSDILIITTNYWPINFYLYGVLGISWVMLWFCFGYSKYTDDPKIAESELEFLQHEIGDLESISFKKIPWKKILTCLPLWALVVAHMGHAAIWHALIYSIPKYLLQVHNYDISDSYLVSSLPYLFLGIFTIFTGHISDCIINNKWMNKTTARKVFTTLGAIGPGVYVLAAVYSGCHRINSVVIFSFGMATMSFYYSGTRVNTLDLAPNFSGIIMGIVNGLGALIGIVSTKLVHVLIDERLLGWKVVFWLFLGVLIITSVVFMLWGSAEEQAWNKIDPERNRQNERNLSQ